MCWPAVHRLLIHTLSNAFAEQLLLHSDGSTGKAISEDLGTCFAKLASTTAWRIIPWMLGNINCLPGRSVCEIVAVIAEHVDVLGRKKASDLLISVFLSQVVSFFCVLVA